MAKYIIAISLVLSAINVHFVDLLSCLSCTDIAVEEQCNQTITCNDQQSCFKDIKITANVGKATLGCISNSQCSVASTNAIIGREIRKLQKRQQSIECHECCAGDRCNGDICVHGAPAACVDDETVDCPRLNSLFGTCKDIHHAKLVCPKFCGLCNLVDGNWADWSRWSSCDVTCGQGTLTRARTCTNPAPKDGGLDCVGNMTETTTCQKDVCPVNGGWSTWESWEVCSVSCDVGLQKRYRNCSNPYPSSLGLHCFGDSTDVRLCNAGSCAGSSQVVAFSSKDATDVTVTSNQNIKFANISLNEGGGYNAATGVFTAPQDGTYLFTTQICLYGGNYLHWAIVANEVELKKGYFGDGNFNKCYTADAVAMLKKGDQVSIKSTTGQAQLLQTGDSWNTFSGVLLHQINEQL